MRYAAAHNFVGRRVAGYERPVCLLTREAAAALAQVQRDLQADGLGLKVYDCYRPRRAVADFARWAHDLADQRTKPEFYPDLDKRDLFKEGYIASRSGHSRGSTVDLTLADAEGRELDMGSGHDLFSPRSWPNDGAVSPAAQANRRRLAEAMAARGFAPYDKEWWHFTLAREPHPDRYFDFPVR
jgi:D-alanyl-D-alanine dipeptidase